MSTAYLTHLDCLQHDMGTGHPEQPDRLKAIQQTLQTTGLWQQLLQITPPQASDAQLARVHSKAYIAQIQHTAPAQGLAYLDADTAMNPYSLSAALFAAGAVVQAVDCVIQKTADNAFCAIRPPGHHALPDRAMGFCIFNNVAVGAAHALMEHGLKRIAIVDFDVHHGNGTEAIFHNDPRVMLCSSFRHPYYPYSGADSANPHIIPMPLPAGSGSDACRQVWRDIGLPALERFQPEMILISAGFDAHHDDPLGGLNWKTEDYAWLTQEVLQIAYNHAQGRLVSTLEGGYDLDALGASAAAHIQALLTAQH